MDIIIIMISPSSLVFPSGWVALFSATRCALDEGIAIVRVTVIEHPALLELLVNAILFQLCAWRTKMIMKSALVSLIVSTNTLIILWCSRIQPIKSFLCFYLRLGICTKIRTCTVDPP